MPAGPPGTTCRDCGTHRREEGTPRARHSSTLFYSSLWVGMPSRFEDGFSCYLLQLYALQAVTLHTRPSPTATCMPLSPCLGLYTQGHAAPL